MTRSRLHGFRSAIAVLTCVFAGLSQRAYAILPSPPPERQYAAQSWIGFSTDDDYTIQLNLSLAGTGSGVILRQGDAPIPFKVTSWELQMFQLHLATRFVSTGLEGAELSGTFKMHVLSYTTTSPIQPNDPMNRLMDARPTDLPGPLELNLSSGGRHIRFGAWPESELTGRLESVRKAALPPSRQSQ